MYTLPESLYNKVYLSTHSIIVTIVMLLYISYTKKVEEVIN